MSTDIIASTESDPDMQAASDQQAAERRQAFIAGLRQLATFYEQQPAIEAPYGLMVNVSVSTRETMARYARLTSWAKRYLDAWFCLVKEFSGGVTLELNIERGHVCRRVVTGTKVVPAQPEQVVEEVEWVCDDALLEAQ